MIGRHRRRGPPATLSVYVGRRFILAVLGMEAGLTAIGALFDFLGLLRQASDKPQAGLGLLAEMEVLRVPWLAMQILPFAVLLGGIYAFWRLSRSSELVVARASGISAWQFLTLPVAFAALLGAFATMAVSPLSAMMYARAESMHRQFLSTGGGRLSLQGGQLWLRQTDVAGLPHGAAPPPAGTRAQEATLGTVAILHASDVQLKGKVLTTGRMTVLRLSPETTLEQRIEARSARLESGGWQLHHVALLEPDAVPRHERALWFPSDLTVRRVQESFASPNALSVWALPGFIRLLARAGFSTTRHELAFQTLLALPLLCATMSLVAAGFSMRPARRGGAGTMIAGGVACGFALFTLSEIAAQFGKSGVVPVTLAAWAPAAAGLLFALTLLLHLEDG